MNYTAARLARVQTEAKKLQGPAPSPAIKWAKAKGYQVPEPLNAVAWCVGIGVGVAFGVLPGLVVLFCFLFKEKQYKERMSVIHDRWIEAGKPAINSLENN